MEFINTDGMAFIGPGSEWFWAMTQFVVVSITLLAIYRQISVQGTANAVQQLDSFNDHWDSDRMLRTRLELALHLRQGDGFDAVYPFLTTLVQFFEDLAGLHEKGHVQTKYVWESWGRTIQFWWVLLAPTIEQGRIVEDQPEGNRPFEVLNQLMRDMDANAGQKPFQPDAAFISRRLDAMITQITAQLRMDRDAKAGAIPMVATVTPEPSPTRTG